MGVVVGAIVAGQTVNTPNEMSVGGDRQYGIESGGGVTCMVVSSGGAKPSSDIE